MLRRIKKLKYRPNLAARALVTGRTHSIGLIVPDLVHPFFADVTKALSRVLRWRRYGLLISSSKEDPALERDEIDQLLARRVDGLIIASTQWLRRSAEVAQWCAVEMARTGNRIGNRFPATIIQPSEFA